MFCFAHKKQITAHLLPSLSSRLVYGRALEQSVFWLNSVGWISISTVCQHGEELTDSVFLTRARWQASPHLHFLQVEMPLRARQKKNAVYELILHCFDINSHMRCCHDAREYANQNFNECTLVIAWTRRTRNEGFSRLYCSYCWVLIWKLVELHEDIIFTKQLVYESHLEKTQGLLSTARINSMLPNYTSTVRWFLWDVEFVPVFTLMTSCWMIVNYSKTVFSRRRLFKVYGAIKRYLIFKIDVPEWRH